MNYWGGGDPDGSGCACDVDKSCVDPDFVCNCDKNDEVLREDSGYLTSKDDLPMFGFFAGDTGTLTILKSYAILNVFTSGSSRIFVRGGCSQYFAESAQ